MRSVGVAFDALAVKERRSFRCRPVLLGLELTLLAIILVVKTAGNKKSDG
jgi:hypothetical protein